jgi:hypothetical protein
MKRLLLIAVFLLFATLTAVLWLQRARFQSRQAPGIPRKLDLKAAVKPDTEFRIFRRLRENNHWDDGIPFDRNTALTVLDIAATAAPWDGKKHAAAYSPWDIQPPELTIILSWCKDMEDKRQRDTQSIRFCYGNWLFWYGDNIYQLSKQSRDEINHIFPENQ